MDTALVTGADRGIGLQIARQLVELGYRVYGLAPSFAACNWQHHDFLQITCDLSRVDHLQQAWEHIVKHDPQVGVVVHAGISPVFAEGFESVGTEAIAHSVQGGLLAPLLLTRWALPSLIRFRGYVINIGWNGQGTCQQGALAAAVEGGLYSWAQNLFEELRDTGVKVCTVCPRRNSGAPDSKARLKLEPQSEVDAGFVAKAVAQILQFKENNLIAELVVRPQGTREEPRIAPNAEPLLAGPKDIVLPDPDKRPPPIKPIPTPEPRRPDDAWEFDDEDDEDEWEEDDELDALLESSRRLLREQNETARRQLQRTREKAQKAGQKPNATPRPERKVNDTSRPERKTDTPPRPEHKTGGEQRSGHKSSGAALLERKTDNTQFAEPKAGDAQAAERDGNSARQSFRAADSTSAERNAVGEGMPHQSAHAANGAQGEGEISVHGEEGKRRRRRRRGGRGRNRRAEGERSAQTEDASQRAVIVEKPADMPAKTFKTVGRTPSVATEPRPATARISTATEGSAPVASRATAATGKAPVAGNKTVVAESKAAKKETRTLTAEDKAPVVKTAKEDRAVAAKAAPSAATTEVAAATPAKKQAAKKATAKKAAAKKVAVEKTPAPAAAKKAVKKTATKKTAAKKATAKEVAAKVQD